MECKHRSIFAEIAKTYVYEFSSGSMIPVTSVDKSTDVKLMNIVKKTLVRRKIFWHKSKYNVEKIPLEKLLVPGEILKLEETSKMFGSYSLECSQSMNASLDVRKTGFIGGNVSASDTKVFKVNLETKRDEIDSSLLNDLLNNRLIDLKNQAVREIRRDSRATLCVVTAVYPLVSDAHIQKSHGRNAQAGLNSEVGGVVNVGVNGGIKSDSQKFIDLKKGTTLAYKVSELQIDPNTGRAKVVSTENGKGGFISMADAKNADGFFFDDPNHLQMMKNVMMPILECSEECKNKLQKLVYDLRREPSDVMMMIDFLDSDGSETNGINPKQKDTWSSLLKLIGLENEDGLYELSPLRTSLVYILEALSEMTDGQFELIKLLSTETAKDLLKVCKNMINGVIIVPFNKAENPILQCPFVRQLAEDMGIEFKGNAAQIKMKEEQPETPPPIFEYVFWVLFAFYES